MPVFGYRLDLEKRSLLRSLPRLPRLNFAAPAEINPQDWHRIEFQENMGACAGHGRSSVSEMAFHIASGGQVTQFSRMFAYLTSQKEDGILGDDNGATIHGACQAAMKYGECPEDIFPYPNPVRYSPVIPDAAWKAAEPFKIRKHYECRGYQQVFDFLASGQGGVLIGINWRESMDNPRNGVVERYTGPGGGGHCVCYLGYSRRVDSFGRKYLWLANSWSESYGNRGYVEVSPKAVDEMSADRDSVMIGMSDLSIPTPRKVDWSGSFTG